MTGTEGAIRARDLGAENLSGKRTEERANGPLSCVLSCFLGGDAESAGGMPERWCSMAVLEFTVEVV